MMVVVVVVVERMTSHLPVAHSLKLASLTSRSSTQVSDLSQTPIDHTEI